jgi:hypothetical protein
VDAEFARPCPACGEPVGQIDAADAEGFRFRCASCGDAWKSDRVPTPAQVLAANIHLARKWRARLQLALQASEREVAQTKKDVLATRSVLELVSKTRQTPADLGMCGGAGPRERSSGRDTPS